MNLIEYIKSKSFSLIIFLILYISIFSMLYCFNVNIYFIISIIVIIFLSNLSIFLHDYLKKESFYKKLNNSLNELDKKYLITEVVSNPGFIEGELLLNYLYEIDKSYIESINKYKFSSIEFKEYIEMWCHEIKTPIATLKLMLENNKTKINDSVLEEINRIESYLEQVLYYSKIDNASEDYIIKKVNLKDVCSEVIKNNKKDLISRKIKVDMFCDDVYIKSDEKWLIYIINQIVTNSIKYSKIKNPFINFTVKINKNNTILNIIDNGIGIKEEEIEKVFNKGYTGSNGRINSASTGIGLYICKMLCEKLGYSISIASKTNIETLVSIIFPKSSMITEIK